MGVTKFSFLTSLTIVLLCSCKSSQTNENSGVNIENCTPSKIRFDLTDIDKRGLIGSPENMVGLDFEFCIPNKESYISEVMAIDASFKTLNSKGRSNCSDNYLLVTGSTYNKDYKKILCKISQLEYVKEINQTFWE